MTCEHRRKLRQLYSAVRGYLVSSVSRSVLEDELFGVKQHLARTCVSSEQDIEEALAFAQIQIDEPPIVYEPAKHLSDEAVVWITCLAHAMASRFHLERDELAAKALHDPTDFYRKFKQYMSASVQKQIAKIIY